MLHPLAQDPIICTVNDLTWTTEQKTVGSLKASYKNPRILKNVGAEVLKESLKKFNQVDCIVLNADNTIISGHQRVGLYMAAHGPDFVVDCRVPSRMLTEEEAAEYRIRANTHAGEWDFDLLANEYDLADLVQFGITPGELGLDLREPAPPPAEMKLSFSMSREMGEIVTRLLENEMLSRGVSKTEALIGLLGADKVEFAGELSDE